MRPTFLRWLLAATLVATPAFATSITVTGLAGTPGTPGTDATATQSATDGGPGGAGGDAMAISTGPGNVNTATAVAGQGGDGGMGGAGATIPGFPVVILQDPGNGGAAGAGGNAQATAQASGSGSTTAQATATGGDPGTPGAPGGLYSSDPSSPPQNGAVSPAGDATATATATGTANGTGGNVQALVRATGGAFAAFAHYTDASVGGNASASADATAQGDGLGVVAGCVPGFGPNGTVYCTSPTALGGSAGPVTLGQPAPSGGNATSTSSGTVLGDGAVEVHDDAVAGSGGSSYLTPTGGRGGSASSTAMGRNSGSSPVNVSAYASGGTGGTLYFDPSLSGPQDGDGGAAGTATASASGVSTGGGDVSVSVTQIGGAGGGSQAGLGADGASSFLVDAASGSTNGALTLSQIATAGAGGKTEGGTGGNGGDAQSILHHAGSSSSLQLVCTATAGDAGYATSTYFPGGLPLGQEGSAGSALASIDGSNDAGSVDVQATARGGSGGTGLVQPGTPSAVVTARGETFGDGNAVTVGAPLTGTFNPYHPTGAFGGNGSGPGGAGGAASSRSTGIAHGDSTVDIHDFASGGGGQTAAQGTAAAGGSADASGDAENGGVSGLSLDVWAIGGKGGQIFPLSPPLGPPPSAASVGGVGGSSDVSGTAISTGGGDIHAVLQSQGGDGGRNIGPGTGGAGGTGQFDGSFTGSTSGLVDLRAVVTGGTGGSTLVNQTGGTGGGDAGRGGDALASWTGENAGGGALSVALQATGGDGGSTVDGGRGGDGGAGVLGPIVGQSSTGADVTIRGVATGGNGGSGGTSTAGAAGDGASISVVDALDGSTAGALVLDQEAVGGNGGGALNGPSGRGGDAESSLTRAASAASFQIKTRATGGAGAGAIGGDARATSDATNDVGDAVAQAAALGGAGGTYAQAAPPPGGSASSTAHADAIGAGDATAQATSAAGSGSVPVQTSGGDATSAADAHAQGNGSATAIARANSTAQGNAVASASGVGDGSGLVTVTATATALSPWATGQVTAQGLSLGGGDVSVSGTLQAGDGIVYVHAPSNGEDAALSDVVSGSTAGLLTLSEKAVAGGGTAYQGPAGSTATGGSAHVTLDGTNPGGGGVHVIAEADGGAGFDYVTTAGDAFLDSVTGTSTDGAAVTVEAKGAGGDAVGSQSGGVVHIGRIYGSSNGGPVRVRLEDKAGGSSFYTYSTGPGASGPDVLLSNAVDGSTSGALTLEQRAVGGAGGAAGSNTPGAGGAAASALTRADAVAALGLVTEAVGGRGGDLSAVTGTAADGGGSTATVDAQNQGGTGSAHVLAQGGSGGNGSGGASGGRGGDATTTAHASSTGNGHDVLVGDDPSLAPPSSPFLPTAPSTGAIGGNGGATDLSYPSAAATRGGDGGAATSQSFGQAYGDSSVQVYDRAQGGVGGTELSYSLSSNPLGGDGGAASSLAEARTAGNSASTALAQAFGGAGGAGKVQTGRGGKADALARAIGLGDVSARAEATGGLGPAGLAGVAHAFAHGQGATGAAAAQASEILSGTALSKLSALASSDVAGRADAESSVVSGLALPAVQSASVDARTAAIGAPDKVLVTAATAASPQVAAALSGQPVAQVMALAGMAADHVSAADGTSITFHTELDLDILPDALGGKGMDVFAGWLDPQIDATGFQSMHVQVEEGQTVVLDQDFASAQQAIAFFTDHVLDLGDLFATQGFDPATFTLTTLPEPIRIAVDYVGSADGAGFSLPFLVGGSAVPEPASDALLATALLGLGVVRRRRGQRRP